MKRTLGVMTACVALAVACSEPASSLTDGPPDTPRGGEQDGDDGRDDAGARAEADGGGQGRDGGGSSDAGRDAAPGDEPGTLAPGTATRTYDVAGQGRSVIVVVPSQATAGKLPLVLALHGNGDSAANFIATTGLEALAADRGFVLAAPVGIKQTVTVPGAGTVPNVSWDAYRSEAQGNIDLPLLDAVVADLLASGSIDQKRILTYGYSQGGYLSFRYGIDRAASLSCAAVIAAASPLGPQLIASAARKIAFSIQIGTGDYAIDAARQARNELQARGFPLDYVEVSGAGHVPFPGDKAAPLDKCLARALP